MDKFPSIAAKLLPCFTFVLWQVLLIVSGGPILTVESSLHNQKLCGEYHIWRYLCFNVVLSLLELFSYFMTQPGESARVRALSLSVFHFAFSCWGMMMFIYMSEECLSFLGRQYSTLVYFHYACVVSNILLFVLLVFHEAYLGPRINTDLTIVPAIVCGVPDYPGIEDFPKAGHTTQPDLQQTPELPASLPQEYSSLQQEYSSLQQHNADPNVQTSAFSFKSLAASNQPGNVVVPRSIP